MTDLGVESRLRSVDEQPDPALQGQERTEPTGSLLQRVILPHPGDPLDVRTLYLDEDRGNPQRAAAPTRTTLRLPTQAAISFATYFNAFPASYWRRWSTVGEVELRIAVQGECRIDIYRSKADGTPIHVRGDVLSGPGRHDARFPLDLAPFEDGGWYWFDLTTADEQVSLLGAGWYTPAQAPGEPTVAVGICTFNRPDDCAAALAALGEDPLVAEALDAVIVVDQGTRKVRDAAVFPAAAEVLGSRLRIVDQANLGGSGGFARVMHEALTATDAEHILLLDDDIVVEPDSVLRALAFARFAAQPMIVGGHMLNLQARSQLRAMGEVVDRSRFTWQAAPNVTYDHDFAKRPLRHQKSAKLHRRIDSDYNGWWMCLIPRLIVEKLGLPLPLFIKWDDAEYSLRAQAAGHPTVSLPGAAIWHMPWSDKDDATDWQAYFHLRNRLVVAALHSGDARPTAMIKHDLKITLKYLMSLQYSTVALRELAMRDFLAGPDALFSQLRTALAEIQARRTNFSDGVILPSAKDLPRPSMDPVRASRFLKPPANPLTIGASLATGLVHNVMPVDPANHERPQLNIPAQDAQWFLLARLDGATVGTADGRGVVFRKRDRRLFRSFLTQALADNLKLAREFPRLRREYREALPRLTSAEEWTSVFNVDGQ